MSLLERTRPGLGIIEPCLPSPAKAANLSIVLNEHFEEDAAMVFREACRLLARAFAVN